MELAEHRKKLVLQVRIGGVAGASEECSDLEIITGAEVGGVPCFGAKDEVEICYGRSHFQTVTVCPNASNSLSSGGHLRPALSVRIFGTC